MKHENPWNCDEVGVACINFLVPENGYVGPVLNVWSYRKNLFLGSMGLPHSIIDLEIY